MNPLPFARPFIGREEEEAVLRVLRSGWLTTGNEALSFEREFAAFLSEIPPGSAPQREARAKTPIQALAVNSATSGLHLALEALGIGADDLVIVPSYTFAATAETVRYLGAEPVFADCAPDSYNISPESVEEALARCKKAFPGKKPRALIPVHYGGFPCDMEALLETARRHSLFVVEDAAHAFPVRCGKEGPYAGCLGSVGVFSFYATKTITTGEGGMVISGDTSLIERMSLMRLHGIDRAVWNRYSDSAASWYYEIREPGFKYNLSDIHAAIGRVQLGRANALLAERQAIAMRYNEAFAGRSSLRIPPWEPVRSACHLYPLRISGGGEGRGETARDRFAEAMQKKGIGVSVHFIPLHIMPYYRDRYGLKSGDLNEAFKRYRETVSLPIWPGMGDESIARVIDAVLELCG